MASQKKGKVKILKARLSDEKQILALERRVWKSFLGLNDVADKYDLGSFIRFGWVFVAKSGKKVVGAIIAIRTNRNDIFVADWVVDEKCRRQGIGKALYKRMMKSAGRHHIVSLISSRYRVSLQAHKKMGFREKRVIRDAYGVGEKESYHLLYR